MISMDFNTKHIFQSPNSSVVRKMLSVREKSWIIVGLAVVQYIRNYHRWLISVKHAVASMKWASAPVRVSVISCTWNRSPGSWGGLYTKYFCWSFFLIPPSSICSQLTPGNLFPVYFYRYLYSRSNKGNIGGGKTKSRSRSPPRKRSRERRRSRSRDRRGRY